MTTVQGLSWSVSGQVVKQLIQVVSVAIIARQVAPEVFGVVAAAMVVVALGSIATDAGLSQYLVVSREPIASLLPAANRLSLGLATFLGLAIVVVGGVIVRLFGITELEQLLPWAALGVFFHGMGVVPRAVLLRAMRIRSVVLSDVAGTAAGSLAALIAVSRGGEIVAVAMYYVLPIPLVSVLLRLRGRTKHVVDNTTSTRVLFRTSAAFGGAEAVNVLARQGDNALAARFLGAEVLGYYSQAYRVLMAPMAQLNAALGQVVLPHLANLWREESDDFWPRAATYGALMLVAGGGAGLFIVGLAELGVLLLLGDQWSESVSIVRRLALSLPFQAGGVLIAWVLRAVAAPQFVLKIVIVNTISYLFAFALGVTQGADALAVAYASATGLALATGLWGLVAHGLPTRLVGRMLRPLLSLAPLLVVVWLGTSGVGARAVVVTLIVTSSWLMDPFIRGLAMVIKQLLSGNRSQPPRGHSA